MGFSKNPVVIAEIRCPESALKILPTTRKLQIPDRNIPGWQNCGFLEKPK